MNTLRLFLAVCSMALLLIGPVQAQGDSIPVTSKAAKPEKVEPPVANPYYYIELRDAPVMTAVDLLAQGAGVECGFSEETDAVVTVRLGGGSINEVLKRIVLAASVPLEFTRPGGTYMIQLRKNSDKEVKKASETTKNKTTTPVSLETVPRRVAGIVRSRKEWLAILITRTANGEEEARTVRIGDTVATQFRAVPTAKVTKIAARTVTLTTPDGKQTLTIPLQRKFPSGKPDAETESVKEDEPKSVKAR